VDRPALDHARGRAGGHRLDGAAAICAQHEYDHLDGIVTFDRGSADARRTLEAEYAG
jgi:peptide deformylase